MQKDEDAMGTVLLVEDDVAVRRVLRRMLESLGYTALEAGSAQEALRTAADHGNRIDVMLTDVVMPQSNCDDLAERLHAYWPAMRVILMSGYSEEMLNQYGCSSYRENFIQKPFTIRQLAHMIERVGGAPKVRHGGQAA